MEKMPAFGGGVEKNRILCNGWKY